MPTLGAQMTVCRSPELRSSLGLTGLSSLIATRKGRGLCRGPDPHTNRGAVQVHGAPRLQSNQQHDNMVEYEALIFGLSTTLSLGV
jgi:hypothetical protein